MGSILPDMTGGMYNTFEYKNFQASFTIDWQSGGQFNSISRGFGRLTGILEETAGLNELGNPKRDPITAGADSGGLLVDGVYADGTPNTTRTSVGGLAGNNFSISESHVFKSSYIKLREVRVGYNFPATMLSSLPINRLSIAVVSNNTLLIWSDVGGGIDPSEVNGHNRYSLTNGAWVEGGALPPTRSVGFDVKVGF